MADYIDILRSVFPVAATTEEGKELTHADFFGTAFAVCPGVFLTAAHVVQEAQNAGAVTLCAPIGPGDGHPMGGKAVDAVEIFPDHDVALMFVQATAQTVFDVWRLHPAQVLSDLSTFGYPHATTMEESDKRIDVAFRAYKGHVITIRTFERLPSRPAVYECSCVFPGGLSGAPLLERVPTRDNATGEESFTIAVAGVVIGSSTVEYGGIEHRVGIAVTGDQVLNLRSERLGGKLGDKLPLNVVV